MSCPILTLAQLLADCDTRGVQLLPAADGRLTINAPEDALTPDLVARLRTHKPDVLAILRSAPDIPAIAPGDAAARVASTNHAPTVWQATLERLEGDPLFPPEFLADLRQCSVRWEGDGPQHPDDPQQHPDDASHHHPPWAHVTGADVCDAFDDELDPADIVPCPACGSLLRWWSVAEREGPGHCLRCEPPQQALAWLEHAGRLKRHYDRPDAAETAAFAQDLRRVMEVVRVNTPSEDSAGQCPANHSP